jgi:dolichol-phosphate mannosyltransferase
MVLFRLERRMQSPVAASSTSRDESVGCGSFNRKEMNQRMISVESWPDSAVKMWTLAQRFQKFVLVGVVGLAVNQFGLMALHGIVGMSVPIASPFAIFASMVVTFLLNEAWTWHDRGRGRVIHRAMSYLPINIGGLVINWGILYYLHDAFGMHYLVANLFGAGVAAIWNFALNNAITWRS